MPVHNELLLFAADLALHANGQIFAILDAFKRPHVHGFAPVAHPVGRFRIIIGFVNEIVRVEFLRAIVDLYGAVLCARAEVRPVVPPHFDPVRRGIGLCVRIAVVKIVPKKHGRGNDLGFRLCGGFRRGSFRRFGRRLACFARNERECHGDCKYNRKKLFGIHRFFPL